MAAAMLAVLFFGCVNRSFADGGRLRFRQPAGPFIVTLFTAPDPLTTGPADFSVAVERNGTPGLVQGADVEIILTPAQSGGTPLLLHASHAEATSKWLQAVNFSLPARGLWRVQVVVRRGPETGECSGAVWVKKAGSPALMWDVFPVPLAALLFLLHQNRKRKYNRSHRSRVNSLDVAVRS